MIRNDILRKIKPELRHLCQNGAFFGNPILQNMIKGGNSVCRHNDKALAVVINLAHFPLFDRPVFLHSLILFSGTRRKTSEPPRPCLPYFTLLPQNYNTASFSKSMTFPASFLSPGIENPPSFISYFVHFICFIIAAYIFLYPFLSYKGGFSYKQYLTYQSTSCIIDLGLGNKYQKPRKSCIYRQLFI